MEYVIYLLILVVTLALGLLSFVDRMFGIFGAIVGWLGGLYLLNDASLITSRAWDTTTQIWQGYSIPFSQIQLTAIMLALFGILDIFIVLGRS